MALEEATVANRRAAEEAAGRADQEAEEALQVSGQRAQQLVLEKAAIIRDAEEAATRANRH